MPEGFFEFRQRVTRRAEKAATPAPMRAGVGGEEEALTVSQLTRQIERALRETLPQTIHVRGEVSNFSAHRPSGHLYFTLKDSSACIDCVMFKSDAERVKFQPADGMELLAGGQVKVYAQRGRYQLYVSTLKPIGQGALELAFQQLRARLEREGLFDPARKKRLPEYPLRIALVTAAQAAALHDMLKVLQRFSWLKLMLYAVPVQGAQAADSIARALREINRTADALRIDVILLARGGGSLEDLWAFNEQVVARAVAASKVPIVTGIGHEVDVSIADLVADYHAHTPTEAAQVVTSNWRGVDVAIEEMQLRLGRMVRDQLMRGRERLEGVLRHEFFRRPMDQVNSLRQMIDDRQRQLAAGISGRLSSNRRRLVELDESLRRYSPGAVLAQLARRVNDAQARLHIGIARRLRQARQKLAGAETQLASRHPRHALRLADQQLNAAARRLGGAWRVDQKHRSARLDALEHALRALSPLSVLQRGYSMTTLKTGALIRSVSQIGGGERVVTRVADGTFDSIAEDPRQPKLFE